MRSAAPALLYQFESFSRVPRGQPELGSRRLAAGRPDQGVSHGSAEQAGNPIAGFHRCLGLDREADRKPNWLPTTTASQSHSRHHSQAQDATHEDSVRADLLTALRNAMAPDPRTGALISLLLALNAVHKAVDPAAAGAFQAGNERQRQTDRRG